MNRQYTSSQPQVNDSLNRQQLAALETLTPAARKNLALLACYITFHSGKVLIDDAFYLRLRLETKISRADADQAITDGHRLRVLRARRAGEYLIVQALAADVEGIAA